MGLGDFFAMGDNAEFSDNQDRGPVGLRIYLLPPWCIPNR